MGDSKFDYLQQIIQRTRLAHIDAEKRLLRMDLLVKHATVYYACWTVGLSLATLFADSKWLAFLSIVSSIVVALFTVYAGSQNYAVRAEQMKNSYIQLQGLWLVLILLKQRKETVPYSPTGQVNDTLPSSSKRRITLNVTTSNLVQHLTN